MKDVLARLASLRPVLHSEACFKQAFTWEARTPGIFASDPVGDAPGPESYLDLLLASEDGSSWSAVELKCFMRLWHGEVGGEPVRAQKPGRAGRSRVRRGEGRRAVRHQPARRLRRRHLPRE